MVSAPWTVPLLIQDHGQHCCCLQHQGLCGLRACHVCGEEGLTEGPWPRRVLCATSHQAPKPSLTHICPSVLFSRFTDSCQYLAGHVNVIKMVLLPRFMYNICFKMFQCFCIIILKTWFNNNVLFEHIKSIVSPKFTCRSPRHCRVYPLHCFNILLATNARALIYWQEISDTPNGCKWSLT